MTAPADAQLAALIARLTEALGPKGVSTDPAEIAPLVEDWRGRWRGASPLLIKPATTAETAAAVALCAEAGVAMTAQGGNTGLVDGGTPHGEALISMKRMNRIRDVDPLNDAMTVEAGVILADAQAAAEGAERLFPLSLASEGTATIGGLIATNAGGVAVLRYGMMRDLVLGVDAVLPDGRVWNGLRALRKDNTGYDLKQLFIGAEGTLGVVTAATLKLFPRPAAKETAWVAVASPAESVELLAMTRAHTGSAATGFELISAFALDLALRHVPGLRDPLSSAAPWRVLIELSLARGEAGGLSEALLGEAMERGVALDAVIAQGEAQGANLWRIREGVPIAERVHGKALKHDISVPVSSIPAFLAAADPTVKRLAPEADIIAFGHVGDGNLHYNVTPPQSLGGGAAADAWLAGEGPAITGAVHDLVMSFAGSISAEHGIGRLKRDELARRKSPVEMDMMRAVKRALDPRGLMNPGRVV